MSRAVPVKDPDGSGAAYVNDPTGGLGMFGMYVAFGPYPWRYWDRTWTDKQPESTSWTTGSRMVNWPGIAWMSDPDIGATSIGQTIEFLRGALQLSVRWSFGVRSVTFRGRMRFTARARDLADAWVKEPNLVLSFTDEARIESIGTPGCCKRYTELWNPTRRTGNCAHPDRHAILLGGRHPMKITVNDSDWRKLADDMRTWKAAGSEGCQSWMGMMKQPTSNWEFTAWAAKPGAPQDRTAICLKQAEGCVSGLDAPALYRRPEPTRTYRINLRLELR